MKKVLFILIIFLCTIHSHHTYAERGVEKVNATDLNNAYKNLQQNIITLYNFDSKSQININQSLEYLKSLISNSQ